jgi:hypothetical protein
MFPKSKLQKTERTWRHVVFDSRFTRVFIWSGFAIFVTAIFTPKSITAVLLERGFGFWFGAVLVYFASTYFLTMLVAFLRKDLVSGIWMALWTAGIGAIGCMVLRSVFR